MRLAFVLPALLIAAVSFADILQADQPRPKRVALELDWPVASPAEVAFPVYCGLSAPKGAITAVNQVRVIDDAGHAVDAGIETLARWVPETSLKWIGLHFLAQRGHKYYAEFGSAAETSQQLKVRESSSAITVDTGKAQFVLPKVGPLFERVQVGEAVVLAGGGACLLVTDQQGRQADETHGDASEAPQVEAGDGRFAIVRREGDLNTADGKRIGRYVVRLEFQAGTPIVKMQHSFINTENTDEVQYADLSLRLRPSGKGPWKAQFEPSPGAEPVVAELDVSAGDAAYLLQADYPHHGQKHAERELKTRRGEGEYADLQTNETAKELTAGNWAAMATSTGGVLVAVPHLAQLFPKEMEIDRNGLTAHLWSSRGGRLLDYRASSLADHYGAAWLDKQYPGGSVALRKVTSNGQGSARTHDVWLHFFAASDAASVPTVGQLCSQPPLCIQDPHWMRSTEALGPVHPYDPQRFPELERFLEYFMSEYLVGQEARWGDFGFLDHGCGPHYYDNRQALPGATPPRASYRYSGNMYHGQTALWQAYARRGKRLYRDYTDAFHRHNTDYKFVHADLPGARRGWQRGGGNGEETALYWSGRAVGPGGAGVLNGHQGRDMQGFFLQHYLTGDRWGLENVLRFGETFLRDFNPSVLTTLAAYSNGPQPTLSAAALYEHTGDARYLKKLEEIRQVVVDPRTLTGWSDVDYYGAWEKYPNKVAAILADHLASNSPQTRQAFLKAARIWLWDLPPNNTGYQCQDGRVANYAWQMTGDLRYAEYIDERLNRALFEYIDPAGKFRTVSQSAGGPHQGGTHGFNFFETAFYGMDLLAATEGKRQPYTALDTGVGEQATEVWFTKERREPVSFEVRTRAAADLQVRWTPDEANRPHRDYHNMPVHWDYYPNYFSKDAPGLAGGYAKAEVGVETVAGEYRLVNVPLIFKSSAQKLVMVARDGALLRATTASPPAWHFQIPAGKRGAICVSKPVTLKVGGQTVAATPGEWTELTAGESDTPATFTAQGLVFVNFRGGIPPVLAEHTATRYFVPREVLVEMPAREKAAAAQRAVEQSADSKYVPGLTGRDSDQAALLNRGRTLKIPRGKSLGSQRYEFIDYSQGSLEFWFQPRWSTGSVTTTRTAVFLADGFWPCSIRHYNGDDEDPRMASNISLTAPCNQRPPLAPALRYPAQDLRNVHAVQAGSWHHLAVCWATDPERGWLSELYLDGQPALGWARYDVGLGRFLESEKPKFHPAKPWPIDEPKGSTISILGEALDAAVDELRISSSARYLKPFTPPTRRRFEADDDTMLLLHFDGNVIPQLPATAAPLKVELR
jgi:hypothetical protein